MDEDSPYTTVAEPTFVARFLLSSPDDPVNNVDVFVELPDGSNWALTMFSLDEVRRLLDRGDLYFWGVDDVIVPEPGLEAMTAAIRELVRSGDVTVAGIRTAVE